MLEAKLVLGRHHPCIAPLTQAFPCSSKPTSPERGWFIPPFGGNPWWVYLAAAIPALLVTILIFMDQQITAVIVNRKEHKLKVGVPCAWSTCRDFSSCHLPPLWTQAYSLSLAAVSKQQKCLCGQSCTVLSNTSNKLERFGTYQGHSPSWMLFKEDLTRNSLRCSHVFKINFPDQCYAVFHACRVFFPFPARSVLLKNVKFL